MGDEKNENSAYEQENVKINCMMLGSKEFVKTI